MTQCTSSVHEDACIEDFLRSVALARSSPLTWLLLPLFYVPGATYVGTRVYTWIARNRRRFGCQAEVESTRQIQAPPPQAKSMSHPND